MLKNYRPVFLLPVCGKTFEKLAFNALYSFFFNSWTTIFLVYINDICSNLSSNVKLVADDTSLISIVNDANKSFQNLRNDLCITSNLAYQWKMSFNPDRSKQAQEVIFLRKTSIQSHPVLTFDNYVGLY